MEIEGKVFYSCWGYDQTNYDYVIVDKVSPTGKTALCRLAKWEDKGAEGHYIVQKPKKEGYGLPFRLRLKYIDGRPILRGSYPYCSNQADDPNRSMRKGTFHLANNNETFNETNTIFGH